MSLWLRLLTALSKDSQIQFPALTLGGLLPAPEDPLPSFGFQGVPAHMGYMHTYVHTCRLTHTHTHTLFQVYKINKPVYFGGVPLGFQILTETSTVLFLSERDLSAQFVSCSPWLPGLDLN